MPIFKFKMTHGYSGLGAAVSPSMGALGKGLAVLSAPNTGGGVLSSPLMPQAESADAASKADNVSAAAREKRVIGNSEFVIVYAFYGAASSRQIEAFRAAVIFPIFH